MAMLVQEPGPDPDMSALVYCSSNVLLQAALVSSISWTLLFFGNLDYIGCGACSVVRQYDEPVDGVHSIFINMIRCSGEKSECLGQFR